MRSVAVLSLHVCFYRVRIRETPHVVALQEPLCALRTAQEPRMFSNVVDPMGWCDSSPLKSQPPTSDEDRVNVQSSREGTGETRNKTVG
jgi:hypothetical protein